MPAIKVSDVVKQIQLQLPPELSTSTTKTIGTVSTQTSWASVASPNRIFASPTVGSGVPTFRTLVDSDMPVISISKGGTGSTDASGARTALGLAIGSNVQAWNAGLDSISGLTGTGFVKRSGSTYSIDTSTYLTGNQTITFSGDATGSGTTSVALTLANTGVSAGTYSKVTVDAKGRVTSGAALASGDLPAHNHTLAIGNGSSQQMTVDTNQRIDIAAGSNITIAYDDANNRITINSTATVAGNTASATALATGRSIQMTGDVTYSSSLFDGTANVTGVATLANSGVTAGTYNSNGQTVAPMTVDAKGRITSVGTPVAVSPIWSDVRSKPTTLAELGVTDLYTKTECNTLYNSKLTNTDSLDANGTYGGDPVDTIMLYGQANYGGDTMQFKIPASAIMAAAMSVNDITSPFPYSKKISATAINAANIKYTNPYTIDTFQIPGPNSCSGIVEYEMFVAHPAAGGSSSFNDSTWLKQKVVISFAKPGTILNQVDYFITDVVSNNTFQSQLYDPSNTDSSTVTIDIVNQRTSKIILDVQMDKDTNTVAVRLLHHLDGKGLHFIRKSQVITQI